MIDMLIGMILGMIASPVMMKILKLVLQRRKVNRLLREAADIQKRENIVSKEVDQRSKIF